jgi:hypothetical protein
MRLGPARKKANPQSLNVQQGRGVIAVNGKERQGSLLVTVHGLQTLSTVHHIERMLPCQLQGSNVGRLGDRFKDRTSQLQQQLVNALTDIHVT